MKLPIDGVLESRTTWLAGIVSAALGHSETGAVRHMRIHFFTARTRTRAHAAHLVTLALLILGSRSSPQFVLLLTLAKESPHPPIRNNVSLGSLITDRVLANATNQRTGLINPGDATTAKLDSQSRFNGRRGEWISGHVWAATLSSVHALELGVLGIKKKVRLAKQNNFAVDVG